MRIVIPEHLVSHRLMMTWPKNVKGSCWIRPDILQVHKHHFLHSGQSDVPKMPHKQSMKSIAFTIVASLYLILLRRDVLENRCLQLTEDNYIYFAAYSTSISMFSWSGNQCHRIQNSLLASCCTYDFSLNYRGGGGGGGGGVACTRPLE